MVQLLKANIITEEIGSVKMWSISSIPDGWLVCDGSAISRTAYADLFNKIGTTWGVGDGSTTFNIPDSRGACIVGVGTSTGYTQNETIALAQKDDDKIQGHYHKVKRSDNVQGKDRPVDLGSFIGVPSTGSGIDWEARTIFSDGTNGAPRTGNVTHGKRIGMYYIIKYI